MPVLGVAYAIETVQESEHCTLRVRIVIQRRGASTTESNFQSQSQARSDQQQHILYIVYSTMTTAQVMPTGSDLHNAVER